MFPQQILLIFIPTGRQIEAIRYYDDDENVAYITLVLPYQFVYCISLGFSELQVYSSTVR